MENTVPEAADSMVPYTDWKQITNCYEVNLRQYTPEGTINAFLPHLARLRAMGINTIWLMPIYPIGSTNRKGELGSPYSVKDYMAVNPDLGTIEDFKKLVYEAHTYGMHVILDWVANHSAPDNPLVKLHPDWYTKDSLGNVPTPPAGTDWTDVADFDYASKSLEEYMISAMKFWVDQTKIDGFRCDVADMVPLSFWQKARVELLKSNKYIFMLAECEKPQYHQAAFDATYCWSIHHVMNEIAKETKNADDLVKLIEEDAQKFPPDAMRMQFTSNHDENSWNGTEYERLGKGAETFAVLTFTIPGFPLIYSGQEAANKKRLKFFDKDEINWKEKPLNEFYKTLLGLKRRNPALWNGIAKGDFKRVNNSPNTLIFERVNGNHKVLAIFNLSPKKQTEKVQVTFQGMKEKLNNGITIEKQGKNVNLELKGWGYSVWSTD